MAMPNPFEALKFRWVLLGLIGASVALGLGLSLLEMMGWLPIAATDPLLQALTYLLLSLGLWPLIGWLGRKTKLRYRHLFGPRPQRFSWVMATVLTVALLMFSLGAFQVSFYGLSFLAPELVEETLQQPPTLFTSETAVPWLYSSLMMLNVVMVAPIAEEFIFRGVLLHRWGTKWNTPAAVVVSSLLFGILHTNVVGLFVFGLVMALLYLRTRSLWAPIFCHMLNNILAIALELLAAPSAEMTLSEFRENSWVGLILMAASAPWLLRFILQNWSKTWEALPYFVNAKRF
ncbi:type II CAAX endopeptidase family protein [Sphaerothrix gracilis]|uniref:CPBP family intramembrane glutamic endopeptidase n=1 Tax=Sphaerothrix gracilis TaxID=3151835 RepID=UPI0031FCFC47